MALPPTQVFRDGQVIHYIRGKWDVAVDGAVNAATKVLNKSLPKNALIVPGATYAYVETAFNGTTPTMKVGLRTADGTLDDDALFASADIAPATDNKIKAAVVATLEAGGLYAPLTEAKEIVLTYGEGADDVTAGLVHFCIGYIPDLTTGNAPS